MQANTSKCQQQLTTSIDQEGLAPCDGLSQETISELVDFIRDARCDCPSVEARTCRRCVLLESVSALVEPSEDERLERIQAARIRAAEANIKSLIALAQAEAHAAARHAAQAEVCRLEGNSVASGIFHGHVKTALGSSARYRRQADEVRASLDAEGSV